MVFGWVNGIGMDGVGMELFEKGDVVFVVGGIGKRVVVFGVVGGLVGGGVVLLVSNIFYEELGVIFVEEFGFLWRKWLVRRVIGGGVKVRCRLL